MNDSPNPPVSCVLVFLSLLTGIVGLIGFPILLEAQDAHSIRGVWQEAAHEVKGKYAGVESGRLWSFTLGGRYRIDRQSSDTTGPCIQSGRWHIGEDGKSLRLVMLEFACFDNPTSGVLDHFRIERVDSVSMVLLDENGTMPMRIHLLRQGSIGVESASSLKKTYLVSPGKKIALHGDQRVMLIKKSRGESGAEATRRMWGYMEDATDSLLILNLVREVSWRATEDKEAMNVIMGWKDKDGPLAAIPVSGTTMHITRPAGRTAGAVGNALLLGGVLAALVVAPVASISFGKGTLNEGQYFTMVGVGLASVALSIPLQLAGRGRTYALSPGVRSGRRPVWKVVRE